VADLSCGFEVDELLCGSEVDKLSCREDDVSLLGAGEAIVDDDDDDVTDVAVLK
jgi:hypothetical protein